ncbi:NHL repeat-containing protein [Flavobacterium commune]|uniref:ATP-binding protein n=1 Tax=Flavobacterium commune TaxID=1306519 RepID=A0A1D9P923_9FLAO|nr:ATP-binding protein [Flavobacterium commune]AOZ99057.1 ATP-binding protein [Flavobacterium commune]
MKYKFLSLSAFIILSFTTKAQQLSKPIWESKNLRVPESVLYSAADKKLYVSLIDGAGNVKDGKGGIAVLDTDGSVKNANWIEGLNAPKGLVRFKNTLFVADIDAVVSIDILTGKIIDKVAIENAVFLNDVTVDDKGVVYVSDTRTNKIHRIKNGQSELYLENVTNANGLKWINKNLYVLANTELLKIDKNKNRTVVAKGFEKQGDGVEQLKNGDFIVSCWAGLIYYVKANGEISKLQDVQGQMNTADLGYNPKENILYIPTFNHNSVIAYKLLAD